MSALIWIISALVTKAGVTAQFNSLMDLIVQTTPYIFGFLATIGLAPAVHEYAASVKAPVIGSKRSPERAEVEAISASTVTTLDAVDLDLSQQIDARLLAYFQRAGLVETDPAFNWKPTDKPPVG